MRLILNYFAIGIDGRGADACFQIEAESKDAAKQAIRDAAEWATVTNAEHFEVFGARHYTHNFVSAVPAKRLEYLCRLAELRGRPAPKTFVAHGQHYGFQKMKLLTVDEWFASAGQVPQAVAA